MTTIEKAPDNTSDESDTPHKINQPPGVSPINEGATEIVDNGTTGEHSVITTKPKHVPDLPRAVRNIIASINKGNHR